MKRSLEVLLGELDSLNKERSDWSAEIGKIRQHIVKNELGDAELELNTFKTTADSSPRDTQKMAWSARVESIQHALNNYRNASADYEAKLLAKK